ncbi:S-layer homology domain-containing protein [Planococcus sp. 4-30]|uniref:CAP and S-layer homology domain-containing protein n=1 Tax=Planococcus sp. 4-30 TaxID=2874583 RepID=UPI001CC0CFFF|nr:S-layer homology domain-containing protein [Planococcus sp. 4-30]
MKKPIISALIVLLFLFSTSPVQAHHFPDLSKYHFAYYSIHNLSKAGILNGYSNGKFGPNDNVTRAQAALILAKTLKLDLDTAFKPKFTDVPTNHYAYKEIAALTEKGVFADVKKFNPASPLPRSQMAKIIIEGFDIVVDNNHEINFKDVPSTYWAHSYIVTMAEVNITRGVTTSTFQPETLVTRAQLAAFIERSMQFAERVKTKTVTYDSGSKIYSGVTSVAYDTIALVNEKRQAAGVGKVLEDPELSKIAQLKAEDMARNNYFDHTSPTYGLPWEMAVDLGYPTNQVGENLASGYITADETVMAWMESPGHKDNLLLKSYTVIGVGYMEDSDGFPYWVHMYAIR